MDIMKKSKKWKVISLSACKECGGEMPKPSRYRTFCSKACRVKFHNWNSHYSTPELRKQSLQRNRKMRDMIVQRSGLYIPCKICGRPFKKIGSHVIHAHKMSAREYRECIGADVSKAIITQDVKEKCARRVFETGMWRNLKAGKNTQFKPGDKRAGRYMRSPETLERLRNRHTTIKQY